MSFRASKSSMKLRTSTPARPRVYVLRERELRRLRLPRATTPVTLGAAVGECTARAARDEAAQTLPVAAAGLRVRVFFCSGGRAVVALVHEQQQHRAARVHCAARARVRALGRAGERGAGETVAFRLSCIAIMHAHCAQEHAKA